jgi:thiol-disulfide isomerase/thioredoxin
MTNRKIITSTFFSFLLGLAVNAQPKQGQLAADIALPSVNGDTIRLSSLKGKVVFLDFWASWCGPCRASNKELVRLYSKYKNKGFEILGVSLDQEKADWRKAVATDKITWLQVNADGGWESPGILKWQISALPTSFLIDKNGTLLAMNLKGKGLEKALKHLIDK